MRVNPKTHQLSAASRQSAPTVNTQTIAASVLPQTLGAVGAAPSQAIAALVAQANTSVSLAPIPAQNQHDGTTDKNACGTTALSDIMKYFNGTSAPDHFAIDRDIRPVDQGTPEDSLVSYAQSHGFRASLKDNASLDDIKALIDQGVPAQVLIDPKALDRLGSDLNTHYVVVSGYTLGPDGKIASLQIDDPGNGKIYDTSVAEFEKRWSDIKYNGIELGQNHVLLSFVPNDSRLITGPDGSVRPASSIALPSGVDPTVEPSRATLGGIIDLLGGWKKGDFGQIAGGAARVVLAGAATVGAVAGRYLSKAGNGTINWGKAMANRSLFGKLLAPMATGVGLLLNGAGGLLNAAARIATPIAKAASSVAKAVTNAVTHPLKSIAKAVSHLFHGW